MAFADSTQQRPAAISRGSELIDASEDAFADLRLIEAKFLEFAQAHAVGGEARNAMRLGRFSAHAKSDAPDLFGVVDIAYAAHILGLLDSMTDAEGRAAWARLILSFQSDDGWFRSGDRQGHGVEHATAYALGALAILVPEDRQLLQSIKPFTGLKVQIAARPDERTAPFALSFLDRLHFWRGSHRSGGIPAIVGSVRDFGLDTDKLLGVDNPTAWLDGCWDWFAARVDSRSGYWRLAPLPYRLLFNAAYRRRHNPETAAMGGAVHLYWISERLGKPMPYPAELVETTAKLLQPSGLYEHEPYCIDLDGNFLIGRALRQLDSAHPAATTGMAALRANRSAVTNWFLAREPAAWSPASHRLPGAFAAVAEADLALSSPRKPRWRNVFETTWWL